MHSGFFMKRIIITGAQGLLGEACCRILQDAYEVLPLTRGDVDLANTNKLSDFLNALEFDFLINTAAMSGLEQCLEQPEAAQLVNTEAPRLMAEICHKKGAKMLQISTDYVLDGNKDMIHDESSATFGSGVYAKTKLSAEHQVMKACENSVVARVSWLFGFGRETFVDQVVNTALKQKKASYICDKFSVPNFSDYLVPVICELLESNLTGVVHLSNDADHESWFSYAEKVIRTATDLGLLSDGLKLIKKSNLDDITFFKQERPRYTAMSPKRLSDELNTRVRNWEDGVREYLLQKYENSLTNKEF